jgi:flagellar biosynthesis protein FlhF
MQVKKFEAKSIKDAIGLVKLHMGPDAIILSAKENVKGFGLMGEASVEVTAAVSENKLRDKKQAERKLNNKARAQFSQASARTQREFIAKSLDADRPVTEFTEDETQAAPVIVNPPTPPPVLKENGITAARYADIDDNGVRTPAAAVAPTSAARAGTAATPLAPSVGSGPIEKLQNEIQYLRALLNNFQKMPAGFVSLHPGAEEGLPYELSFAFKRLVDAGVSHAKIVEILKIANERLPTEQKKKKAFVDGWVIKYMLEHLQINDRPLRSKLQIFLGPTGQGKTSTVVKIACHLITKEKKRVAMITGDVIKVGATDQFKIYAQILNAPYAVVTRREDWVTLAPQLANMDYILFDTPGLNLKAGNDLEILRRILPAAATNSSGEAQIHYVQSIMARDTDAFEIAERFKFVGFQDVIFTRLDEAVQFGLIYNFQQQFKVPLHSFGIGNNIPEDFEFASKERVIDLIFNLSQFRKEKGQT